MTAMNAPPTDYWKARADEAEKALYECGRLTGVDTSQWWPLPVGEWVVRCVRELRDSKGDG